MRCAVLAIMHHITICSISLIIFLRGHKHDNWTGSCTVDKEIPGRSISTSFAVLTCCYTEGIFPQRIAHDGQSEPLPDLLWCPQTMRQNSHAMLHPTTADWLRASVWKSSCCYVTNFYWTTRSETLRTTRPARVKSFLPRARSDSSVVCVSLLERARTIQNNSNYYKLFIGPTSKEDNWCIHKNNKT